MRGVHEGVRGVSESVTVWECACLQNVMIKKHALELTTSFIIPLVRVWGCEGVPPPEGVSAVFAQERYLASLMPLKREVSPWRVSEGGRGTKPE